MRQFHIVIFSAMSEMAISMIILSNVREKLSYTNEFAHRAPFLLVESGRRSFYGRASKWV